MIVMVLITENLKIIIENQNHQVLNNHIASKKKMTKITRILIDRNIRQHQELNKTRIPQAVLEHMINREDVRSVTNMKTQENTVQEKIIILIECQEVPPLILHKGMFNMAVLTKAAAEAAVGTTETMEVVNNNKIEGLKLP